MASEASNPTSDVRSTGNTRACINRCNTADMSNHIASDARYSTVCSAGYMDEAGHVWRCFLCNRPAVVWCRQDRAYLCESCDQKVHTAGPLAWKHERTALYALKAGAQFGQASAACLDVHRAGSGVTHAGSQQETTVRLSELLRLRVCVCVFPCMCCDAKLWRLVFSAAAGSFERRHARRCRWTQCPALAQTGQASLCLRATHQPDLTLQELLCLFHRRCANLACIHQCTESLLPSTRSKLLQTALAQDCPWPLRLTYVARNTTLANGRVHSHIPAELRAGVARPVSLALLSTALGQALAVSSNQSLMHVEITLVGNKMLQTALRARFCSSNIW